MTGWLLDTNILSEPRRPRPEPRVLRFLADRPLETLFVSTVSLAEIRFGIEKLNDPVRRAELNEWLDFDIRPTFQGRTLEVSEDVVLKWRLLAAEGRKTGHTYSEPDLIIAATALHHRLAIVTRDRREFERAGASVLNPWTDPLPDPA